MTIDRAAFKRRLLSGAHLVAPGIFDGLSARIADAQGFEALYLSGYGVSASLLAKPDAGFLTADHMRFRIETLCEILTTPLIADADTGFGGLAEIAATVRAYEAAGAAGIQLEDQQIPKRCGHISGREVVARDAAVEKIATAVAARRDPNFLVIARTDAREQKGLDEAIERGRLFAKAGADIIFVEAPESEAEFKAIGQELGDVLLLANMVEGGRSPFLPRARLVDLGFRFIIYPVATMASAAAALQYAYAELASETLTHQRVSFEQLSALVGFNEALKK